MTGGIAKVVIFSFTERGTKQNRYIYRKLKMQGYICEGYAPAKYVMGEEGGVKQLPKKKEDLIRERWGKWAFLFIGAAGIAVRYIAPYVKDKFTDSAVVVADEAGHVFGGHLNEAVISGTGELVLTRIAGEVDRCFDEEIGLNLFRFL